MRPLDALRAGMLHHSARFSVRSGERGADHYFLSHGLRRARGTMALTAREIERRAVEAITRAGGGSRR